MKLIERHSFDLHHGNLIRHTITLTYACQLAQDKREDAGVLVHPTRLACTGATAGPSLYHLMEVLGKERVLKRLAVFA